MSAKDIHFNHSVSSQVSKHASELPFTLQDLRAAIPSECFQPSLTKSFFYFFFDLLIIGLLYTVAYQLDSWFFWPIFWLMQGTMFWALFVIGHDCSHQSFSKYKWLNNLIGHICYTPLLVPYHGWRIAHIRHHQYTNKLGHDGSWEPLTETQYKELPPLLKLGRYYLSLIFGLSGYILFGYPYRIQIGALLIPNKLFFKPSEKWDVITSTIALSGMVSLLAFLTYQWGWMWLLKYYAVPYLIFVTWFNIVVFLNHTEPDIPWYSAEEWTFLKGCISTIDRDYGFINHIHHHLGTHVVHHLFTHIPHYNLLKATEAIKPVLGEYYRKSEEPIWKSLWRSYLKCRVVPDSGDKLYFISQNTLAKS